MTKAVFIIILAIVSVIPLARLIKASKKKCPICGHKLMLDKVKDPAGANITKKITFSLYKGPRKLEEQWICTHCNHRDQLKYWSD